jgi:hypothetical protein
MSARMKRIAFVPKSFTEFTAMHYPDVYRGQAIVAAFCTGACTEKSVQCIYNVCRIIGGPSMEIFQSPTPITTQYSPPSVPSITLPPCASCAKPTQHTIPCRHYVCCTECYARLSGTNYHCPVCQQPFINRVQ